MKAFQMALPLKHYLCVIIIFFNVVFLISLHLTQ